MTMPDRAAALSTQLADVHRSMRERLAALRQQVAAGTGPQGADGRGPTGADDADSADLLSYCLGVCTAISTHHTGEDGQLLPALQAAAPELAPVIGKLIEDHVLVAGLLRQIRELLGRDSWEPDVLLRELDGLAAILESHFGFEERRISRALDALGPGAWTAEVFAPSP